QDSRVISRALQEAMAVFPDILPADLFERPEAEQVELLLACEGSVDPASFDDPVIRDTWSSPAVIRQIQKTNGRRGAHRYIISNCRGPVDMAHVIALFRLTNCGDAVSTDIVPLFETIDDLQRAGESMSQIYANAAYREHLES